MEINQKEQLNESEIIENLKRLVMENKIQPENRLLFFGANKSSLEMNDFLRSQGIIPEGFIDNSPKKQGTIVEGMPVSSPKEALLKPDSNARILIASEYHAEMCQQLKEMGYEKDKQVFVVFTVNDFYDTSKEAFERHAFSVKRGLIVYERLMENKDPRFLFLCPYPGTGDIFLIGGYLGKYMEKHRIKNPLITVVNKSGKRILELYTALGDSLSIAVISQEESNDLVNFMRVMRNELPCLVLNDNFLRVMHRRLRGYKGVDFHTMFKYAVFRMEEKDKIMLPNMDSLPGTSKKDIEEFFKKEGLVPEKTAVLSPYANTISNLPIKVWEKIAGILKEKGYVVCTNSASVNEPAIEGTKPLFIPFSIAVPVLNTAGLFIAMRSGLCDIVASSKCKKIIFYPKGYIFGSCSTYDYFSLNAMGFCNDAVEIEFEAGDYKEILNCLEQL